MDTREVGRYWESNARAWTTLARQGWDVYRDALNTPAFLALLPEIGGHSGLDIGCGDGHNTRLLAARGARMTGIDLAPTFVEHARAMERENRLGIHYSIGSAQDLPFAAERFDFATAFMSLMDMPAPEAALREACRVLRSGASCSSRSRTRAFSRRTAGSAARASSVRDPAVSPHLDGVAERGRGCRLHDRAERRAARR